MASTDNKADLSRLLSESLISQAPNDKDVIVAGGFLDEKDVRSSKGSDVDSLRSTHEEADTRLVLHAAHSRFDAVVVPSRDRDVILLLVAHFRHIHCDNLWVMAGTSKARNFIPVGTVCNSLPNGLVGNLLAFHALTGCDTSHMANHSKQTSWTLFKEHHALLNGLGVGDITEETIKLICGEFCLQNLQSATNRLRRHSKTCSVSHRWEARISSSNERFAQIPYDENPISSIVMEERPLAHT